MVLRHAADEASQALQGLFAGQAGGAGIPDRVATAYQQAGNRCSGLDWSLLAAVGEVESNHGRVGGASADDDTGEVRPWILGPQLDGRMGTVAIPVGRWSGWWGITGSWSRALGPMQFLPGTFDAHAVDADGDGVTDPHDIDDAVASAANYLCTAGGGSIEGSDEVARIYNPASTTYADMVARAHQRIRDAGRHGSATLTACPGPPSGSTEPHADNRTTPATLEMANAVIACFGRGGRGVGCFDRRAQADGRDGPYEHPRGRACDFMVSAGVAASTERARGEAMAEWVARNAEDLNVLYVIWFNRVWSPRDGYRDWEDWRSYGCDGCSPSSAHYDHVHVSVELVSGDPRSARCIPGIACTE